jgi:LysR family pca operon transcriptional activator
MKHRIRMRQLNYFVESARNGSMYKASEMMNVSQPAVTKAINELENSLGVKLFERSKKGVDLTIYGEAFYQHATAAIANIADGYNHIDEIRNAERGHVVVGSLAWGYSKIVSMAIARLKRELPKVVVTVKTGMNADLLPDVALGDVDMVIGRRGESSDMVGLVHDVLFHASLMLVVSPGHPLTKRNKLELADLVDESWLIPPANTAPRRTMDELFHEHNVPFPQNYVEGGSVQFFLDMIDDGRAIAALPNNLIMEELQQGRLIKLDIELNDSIGPVGISRRENSELSRPAGQLVLELRRAAAKLGLRN